ncbi:MAG: hypothetical protein O3B84_05160, partial [Chloroflexi bacterium]|nr:hypothetical protein [Chloroflexota bacterium]
SGASALPQSLNHWPEGGILMGTKPFMALLAIVVVLGFGLGGAFVGGIAVGKTQADTEASAVAEASARPAANTAQQQLEATAPLSADQLSNTRQRLGSGDISPEELTQLRQQFRAQGGAGGDGGFGGFGGGGARGGNGALAGGSRITGTIEAITDGVITLNTQQGPIEVAVGTETTIELTRPGELGDLAVGGTVTVVGTRGDDGTFGAATVTVVPEGRVGAGGFVRGDGAVPVP